MKNPRLALAGLLLVGVAAILFAYFHYNQEGARDPAELMRVVGQIAGAVAGIGLAFILMSFFIGRPQRRR
ncbi:MAG: hypothetical protein QM698_17330 [Micropepsaceae bacterium]